MLILGIKNTIINLHILKIIQYIRWQNYLISTFLYIFCKYIFLWILALSGLGQKLGTQAMDSEWPNPQHIFGGPTQPYNRQFYWKKMVKNYTIHITLLKYEIFALWKVPKLMKHHNFKGSEGSPNLRTEPRTSRTLGLSSKTEPRTYRTPQNGRTSNQVRSKSTI